MDIRFKNTFVCPQSKKQMELIVETQTGTEVIKGKFVSPSGNTYEINNGVPDLTFPFQLEKSDADIKKWYEANADVYDDNLPLTFQTFNEDEHSIREAMIEKLNLKETDKVLEVGAGTGRDSVYIAKKLSENGEFHLQDLCGAIFEKCSSKLVPFKVPRTYHIGNGSFLPFPDNYFDASFHFGGLNTFADIPGFFKELNRVTKVGGKVVVGDESMPEWLRETDFGKILMNSNPHYKYELPLKFLPVSCRKVRLEWIIGGVFYLIDYIVGEGEPNADFDFEIPGKRGGTHRTRYYGHIEGVTQEAVEIAYKAQKISGLSMHKWLDTVIKDAAKKSLKD